MQISGRQRHTRGVKAADLDTLLNRIAALEQGTTDPAVESRVAALETQLTDFITETEAALSTCPDATHGIWVLRDSYSLTNDIFTPTSGSGVGATWIWQIDSGTVKLWKFCGSANGSGPSSTFYASRLQIDDETDTLSTASWARGLRGVSLTFTVSADGVATLRHRYRGTDGAVSTYYYDELALTSGTAAVLAVEYPGIASFTQPAEDGD